MHKEKVDAAVVEEIGGLFNASSDAERLSDLINEELKVPPSIASRQER